MKVLFHCYEFPPQAGGVGSYIKQMAAALMEIGHGSIIVTSRSPGLPECEETAGGLIYRAYERHEIRSSRVRDFVLDLAKKHAVDLMEGADHHGEMAGLMPACDRPPILIKVHGSNPIRVVQNAQVIHPWQRIMVRLAHIRNWRQTLAEKHSIEHADLLQVPSARLLAELKKQGLRLPAKVGVVPNLVMPVPPGGREAAVPTVLFPSRLEIRKGIQYLPALMERLLRDFPDLRLEIAGDDSYARGLGPLRSWLANQMGNTMGHVQFLGRLTLDEMDEAYRRAWVVLLPSRWDNFPMTVLEAMVRGKAVVASPHGGMPEMIAGTSCMIARPETAAFAEATALMLRDSDLRRKAGDSARIRALSEFGPAAVARQYIDFVNSSAVGIGA